SVDTLVVNALQTMPHDLHFNLEEALAFAEKINARKTYFTHIGHKLSYGEVMKSLPTNVELAYDGLKIVL
ncbi:MAG: MBL fold metallo-hydrolase, partial [Bacteroidales bacterium]|nr:MBL fold metallo-hydrolase [Bacteroidales bacterium]